MLKSSLAVLSVGVLLSGCSTQAPEPPAVPAAPPPPAVIAAATPPSAPAAPPELEASYSYSPVGKPDPFRSRMGGEACCLPPTPPACEGPLCRYSLDEFKLAGVISGTANPVAVLESPKGKGYQVYRGSKVGRNGGVVKQVLRDAIVVAEVWRDGTGTAHEQETIIRLQPDLPVTLDE
jgi:type IV pilus assembly protein PilP